MASNKQVDTTPVPVPVNAPLTVEELNEAFGITDDIVPESVDELEALYADQGGIIEFQGSVYDVIKKDQLVDTPFTIVNIRFYNGSYGEACAILCLTDDGEHVVFNDGSTGVYQQCRQMVTRTGRRGGFRCPKGLRASSYDWQEKDFDGNPIGEKRRASTYYVA